MYVHDIKFKNTAVQDQKNCSRKRDRNFIEWKRPFRTCCFVCNRINKKRSRQI